MSEGPKQVTVRPIDTPSSASESEGIQPPVNNNDDHEFGFNDDDEIDVPMSSKVTVAKPAGKSKFSKSELDFEVEGKTEEEIAAKSKEIFRGETFQFSGCQDSQESADVADAEKSFGLKPVDEASRGGGAMTNSLLSTLQSNSDISFGDLLVEMRSVLKSKGYTQIPQLSCSHQINLKETKFSLVAPKSNNGRKIALLIGCNYTGTDAELNGCVNDVKQMKNFLASQGWPVDDPSKCRILTDEAGFGMMPPTGKNILQSLDWMMKDAQPGDSFFLHLSGHGVSLTTFDEGEEDGMDEAYAPVDFEDNGFIRDDVFFQQLVAKVPKGARLVCCADLCHSGTLLDCPHVFVATEQNVKQYLSGALNKMMANAAFSFSYAKDLSQKVWRGIYKGVGTAFDDMKDTMARWKQLSGGWCARKCGGCCCCC